VPSWQTRELLQEAADVVWYELGDKILIGVIHDAMKQKGIALR
jgi:hypothetical protein